MSEMTTHEIEAARVAADQLDRSHTPEPSEMWADIGLPNICQCAVRVVPDDLHGWRHDPRDLGPVRRR